MLLEQGSPQDLLTANCSALLAVAVIDSKLEGLWPYGAFGRGPYHIQNSLGLSDQNLIIAVISKVTIYKVLSKWGHF